MFRKAPNLMVLVLCLFSLNDCSVLMVRDLLDRESKIEQNHVGWTQQEVEKYLGTPLGIVKHEDGSKTCVYEFTEAGYSGEPMMNEKDVLSVGLITLGGAEIFSVPIVLFNKYRSDNLSPRKRAWITYDLENRVKQEKSLLVTN